MSDPRLRLPVPRTATAHDTPKLPLGRQLVEDGVLSAEGLLQGLQMQTRMDAPLGEILVAEGLADRSQVLDAVARQQGVRVVDLETEPPDPALLARHPPAFWLRHRVVPLLRFGDSLLIATARPDRRRLLQDELGLSEGQILCVVADEDQIMSTLADHFALDLARRAEARVPARYSCRHWGSGPASRRWGMMGMAVLLLLTFVIFPVAVYAVLCALALLSLFLIAALKATGAVAQLLSGLNPPAPPLPDPEPSPARLPRISVIVPLYRETEIAGALIRRLSRLRYPKPLLEVVLALEEHDDVTKATVRATELPPWMRVIEVPDTGSVTTKPRALNYALDFCRGDIIGIWDAEDAPDPDQLNQVAAHFAGAPADLACVQGILDYYNPRSNWISRCFTIEYATWFRLVLPGIARMGLVVPLGGTTLFCRRDVLEELGAWDAHNVTEDADLGVRLARAGYRTEMIHSATHEEANCRSWPWVKQRSRWLKGFMVTYLVHMRRPAALLRDLGWKRFAGFQAFFLGSVLQFLLAPLLWSFWLIAIGLPHPLFAGASAVPWSLQVLGVAFVLIEVTTLAIGCAGVSARAHRFLLPWVLTMPVYYPMGALASYKAAFELLRRPFYWDKTQHGQAAEESLHGTEDAPGSAVGTG